MKVIINASDIHSGGGKVLLNDFLNAAVNINGINFHVFTDYRFDKSPYSSGNICFKDVSKLGRVFVDWMIKKIAKSGDMVIYMGDMPPLKKHICNVTQIFQNIILLGDFSMGGFPIKVKIRLTIEKWAFRLFLKNVDRMIVQTLVMKDLLLRMGFSNEVVKVIPYKSMDIVSQTIEKKIDDSFIYVASDEPYKNHKNLISAWQLLKNEGISPLLFLIGINKENELYKYITNQIQIHNLNVQIKPTLARNELLSYYRKVSALIYPSCFECFGLPLIEAMRFKLPIIASELDYVRDLLDPTETFDPGSPRSISRAVKRFLKQIELRPDVLTAEAFIKQILPDGENTNF